MKKLTLVFAIAIACSFCSANVQKELEIINPPVNLTISDKTTYYEVSFYAYNVEQGFEGYGVFAANTEAAAEALASGTEASSAAGVFCTSTASIETAYLVQVGDTTQQSGTSCYINTTTINSHAITSGSYITVRARVDRDDSPWSVATSKIVP